MSYHVPLAGSMQSSISLKRAVQSINAAQRAVTSMDQDFALMHFLFVPLRASSASRNPQSRNRHLRSVPPAGHYCLSSVAWFCDV